MSDPTSTQPQQDITITTNLDGEPKHAEALGRISVAWAALEWTMYQSFEQMSGSPPAVARSIWNAVESSRGRREMLSGIGQVLIDNDSEKNILADILRRISKSSGQRNKFVHDTWGVASTQKHEIFQLRDQASDTQRMEQVTVGDMQNAADHFRKLAEEINSFRERIAPKVQAWLEKYRKLPGLGLVYAPKGHPPGRKPKGYHGRP